MTFNLIRFQDALIANCVTLWAQGRKGRKAIGLLLGKSRSRLMKLGYTRRMAEEIVQDAYDVFGLTLEA